MTPLGDPEVPEVKYITMVSSALVSLRSKLSSAFLHSSVRFLKPGTSCFTVQSTISFSRPSCLAAPMTLSGTSSKGVHITAFTSAVFILYTKSFSVSRWVTGIMTAPILFTAMDIGQYS